MRKHAVGIAGAVIRQVLFKEVKELFRRELVLKIYILSLFTKIEIDILDFILGAYLIQLYLDR